MGEGKVKEREDDRLFSATKRAKDALLPRFCFREKGGRVAQICESQKKRDCAGLRFATREERGGENMGPQYYVSAGDERVQGLGGGKGTFSSNF